MTRAGTRGRPRFFDANGREILLDDEKPTVPDGARVVSNITLMDSISGDNKMNNDVVTIEGKSMTKDAAIAHYQRRVEGLQGQLAALDAIHQQPARASRDVLKERATASARAFAESYRAENLAKQGEPTTPQGQYAKRLSEAWKTGKSA